MNNNIKIIFPLLFLFSTVFMVYKISAKLIQKEKENDKIQTLPIFTFTNNQTGKTFTDNNIEPGKTIFIEYFHPECDFCQQEADQISKQIEKFNNCQFLFISNAEKDSIASFATKYGLSDKQNIVFLYDQDFIFDDIFGKTGTPSTFIYNKEHKLVKHFKGFTTVNEMLK